MWSMQLMCYKDLANPVTHISCTCWGRWPSNPRAAAIPSELASWLLGPRMAPENEGRWNRNKDALHARCLSGPSQESSKGDVVNPILPVRKLRCLQPPALLFHDSSDAIQNPDAVALFSEALSHRVDNCPCRLSGLQFFFHL